MDSLTYLAPRIAVAFVALALAWQLGQPPNDSGISTSSEFVLAGDNSRPSKSDARSDENPRPKPSGQYRGMAVQLHGGPDVYERYHHLIPQVADLGSDTILFVVHGWQEHAGSLDLHIDPQRTASAAGLGKLCDDATKLNMRIILMPIVLLSQPRNNEWRGRIIPPNHDWDAWFKRYSEFILHFAQIAERHHVDIFMVGSELIKSEVYTDRWRRLIASVRQEFRGKLGYSANWDHYQTTKIGFWPQLDCVGMTSYYELAAAANPQRSEIDANWAGVKKDILAFHEEVKKPILFTEVGWCSQEGAAHEPWNYYANQKATEAGHHEQVLLYESFLDAWAEDPNVGGIIWWEWSPSEGGASDYNYTPRAKPTERILRDWFASPKPRRSGAMPPVTAGAAPEVR